MKDHRAKEKQRLEERVKKTTLRRLTEVFLMIGGREMTGYTAADIIRTTEL